MGGAIPTIADCMNECCETPGCNGITYLPTVGLCRILPVNPIENPTQLVADPLFKSAGIVKDAPEMRRLSAVEDEFPQPVAFGDRPVATSFSQSMSMPAAGPVMLGAVLL